MHPPPSDDSHHILETAWEAHHRRDWTTAAARWQHLIAAEPDNSLGWRMCAAACREMKDDRRAADILSEAIDRFPRDPLIFMDAGWLAFHQGDLPLGLKHWERARELNDADAGAWWPAALALRSLGQTDTAARLLERALQQFPNDPGCLFEAFHTAVARNDADEALRHWRQLCVALPPDMHIHTFWNAGRLLLMPVSASAMTELLRHLLTEDIISSSGLPVLWGLATDLRKLSDSAHKSAVHAAIADLMADEQEPAPFKAVHAAIFNIESDTSDLLRDVATLIERGKASYLGAILEANEQLGRLLGGVSAYRVALRPDEAPAASQLELLRLSLAKMPDAFNELIRAVRRRPVRDMGDETSIDGFIEALAGRFRLPEEMNAPPLIRLRDRRLRMALCISGQLRGYRQAWASWQSLGFAHHEVTTVVHCWSNIGRRQLDTPDYVRNRIFDAKLADAYAIAWYRLNGLSGIKLRFPALVSLFEKAHPIEPEELHDAYNTKFVAVEDDQHPPFNSYSNPQKMFYKISAAHNLALTAKVDFDLMIRIRPDRELRSHDGVDWTRLLFESERQRLLFVDGGSGYGIGGFGIGDQIAIGTSSLMNEYAGIWQRAQSPEAREIFGTPPEMSGHGTLSHFVVRNGIRVEVVPDTYGHRLYDAEMLDTAYIAAALRQDIGPTPRDEIDSLMLQACE